MELSSLKIKKLLYFRRELANPKKQTKSTLKKFLIILQKTFFPTYRDDCWQSRKIKKLYSR